ncbi:glycosyltransferase [Candidatus Bathyarchaeota archaeon]|nr:glycosyltransferase [Candidatus Bathyarchaeota archaeon]
MQQVVERPPIQKVLAIRRPTVKGKFLYVGDEKFWVKGISYGTFYVDENGEERLDREVVEKDFALIAEYGFNVVRVHTGPPRWLLDSAQKNGLRVMVGLNWGEQMAFLDEPGRVDEITEKVRRWIRRCAGHPAVFCYTVGNEITSQIVRWHGRKPIEKFVHRLYRIAKVEDPDALVTYVNYPSTEYLRLPFLDFLCFNVYLESQKAFEDYLARLHSLSNDSPVLLSEVGLDSLRNGEEKQAQTLEWQVRSTFKRGCCGLVVFAWTDEWYHGKHLVKDWKFGLTTSNRIPKPALRLVQKAFLDSVPPLHWDGWPQVSVVVCSYNGAATIPDLLDGLQRLNYPDYEVIVVNDGSTDTTAEIVSEYPSVRLINTKNHGLSNARNTGIEAANGELVAFIDDDAFPDDLWLRYLVLSLLEGDFVGVGGHNLPPPSDNWKDNAMGHAPGGPNPVLVSDTTAEHVPGCNMLFRKDALVAIGKFDPQFRAAGDDVDLCWRLIDKGGVIGFAPAALVWHQRRSSVRKYWKQQVGYGKAEALLENKWPNKYNAFGQVKWLGRVYGRGISLDFGSLFTSRVYQGVWGSAPYQLLYQPKGSFWSLMLMPEWYLITGFIGLLFLLSTGWAPWILLGPPLLLSMSLPIVQAAANVRRAKIPSEMRKTSFLHLKVRAMLLFLNILQPLARLDGRLRGGLTPWRRHGPKAKIRLHPETIMMWRDRREPAETTLKGLQIRAEEMGILVKIGGDYDGWDLELRKGLFGGSRLLMAVEEHAPGKQLLRFRLSQTYSGLALTLASILIALSVAAAFFGAWVQSFVSILGAALIITRTMTDSGYATGLLRDLLNKLGESR